MRNTARQNEFTPTRNTPLNHTLTPPRTSLFPTKSQLNPIELIQLLD